MPCGYFTLISYCIIWLILKIMNSQMRHYWFKHVPFVYNYREVYENDNKTVFSFFFCVVIVNYRSWMCIPSSEHTHTHTHTQIQRHTRSDTHTHNQIHTHTQSDTHMTKEKKKKKHKHTHTQVAQIQILLFKVRLGQVWVCSACTILLAPVVSLKS